MALPQHSKYRLKPHITIVAQTISDLAMESSSTGTSSHMCNYHSSKLLALTPHGVSITRDELWQRVLLTIYGIAPGSNSNMRRSDNEQLEKAKEVITEVGAENVAYSEHNINCRNKDNVNSRCHMFNWGEAEIITQTGLTCYENIGRAHDGTLIDQYDFESSKKDVTGLGR